MSTARISCVRRSANCVTRVASAASRRRCSASASSSAALGADEGVALEDTALPARRKKEAVALNIS